MNETDCRLLCEKMGMAWKCYGCHDPNCSLRPTFTTVPEREDVMQWAFQQEWWEGFWFNSEIEYTKTFDRHNEVYKLLIKEYDAKMRSYLFIKWLLRDPAHLPELVLQYGKEVLGWELKEKGE